MDRDHHIVEWLLEESDEEHELPNLDTSGDSDIDQVDNSDHNSESEVSAEDGEIEEPVENVTPFYTGRDGTKWRIHAPPQNRRRARRNIVIHPPGVLGEAKDATTILEAWNLFFPFDVLEQITLHTNSRLHKIRTNYSRESDVRDTNVEEIKALIGLFYLSGTLKSSHVHVEDLWANDPTAPEIFRLVMSYRRFYLLTRALRFDDATTRQRRKATDKLAPIRNIFDGFVAKCLKNYSIGEYVTLDEMLESFRGKCSFRQFMPRKPAKYGIKMFAVSDAKMFYTQNLEVYCGKQPDGPFQLETTATAIVKRMTTPIHGSGRNVTMDNWFSSVPVVNELVTQHNLTVVATMKKNKRELPPETVNTRTRPVNSSLFAFQDNCMIVSYVPKKYKNVLLISSMHDSDSIDEESGDQMKPEIISFYNSTKGGVDVVDGMKAQYSVSRISFRWPLRVFYSLLDIGGINAQIILNGNTGEKIARKKFLKSLALELIKSHMTARASYSGLKNDLRLGIQKYLGLNQPSQQLDTQPVRNRERVKCGYCPKKKNRFTTARCERCVVPICGEHTVTVCARCHGPVREEVDADSD